MREGASALGVCSPALSDAGCPRLLRLRLGPQVPPGSAGDARAPARVVPGRHLRAVHQAGHAGQAVRVAEGCVGRRAAQPDRLAAAEGQRRRSGAAGGCRPANRRRVTRFAAGADRRSSATPSSSGVPMRRGGCGRAAEPARAAPGATWGFRVFRDLRSFGLALLSGLLLHPQQHSPTDEMATAMKTVSVRSVSVPSTSSRAEKVRTATLWPACDATRRDSPPPELRAVASQRRPDVGMRRGVCRAPAGIDAATVARSGSRDGKRAQVGVRQRPSAPQGARSSTESASKTGADGG